MNTIQENNKLIAEFMKYEWYEINKPYIAVRKPNGDVIHFRTDWNDLMEVVEKINGLNNVVEIHDNHVRVVSNERSNALIDVVEGSMLEATYNACVEFIKLYNQKK